MVSRFRVLMVCLGASLVLSAFGVGVAQAARPIQPHFTVKGGETLKSNLTIEANLGRSRMWSTSLGVVFRCEKDHAEGAIEPNGRAKGKPNYSECKAFAAKENATTKQIEEGEELTACTVTVATTLQIQRLGWSISLPFILILFEPASGTEFGTITVTGATCIAKGTFAVEGAVVGLVPRFNTESVAGAVLLNTINEGGKVVQEAKEFVVEEKGVKVEKKGIELTVGGKQAALEEGGEVERIREGGVRGLAGGRE
jgi:hypothetical protein